MITRGEWHSLIDALEDARAQLTLAKERHDLLRDKVNKAIYEATKELKS